MIGILYGALLAIGQRDMKRLVAYSSVSHFGFIALGIFAFTTQGGSGATLYMVNHGFSTGALFLVVGFLATRRGSRMIDDFGGAAKVAPWLGAMVLAGRAVRPVAAGPVDVRQRVPGAGRHVHARIGGSPSSRPSASCSPRSTSCWMYQRTIHGPVREGVEGFRDLGSREAWVDRRR